MNDIVTIIFEKKKVIVNYSYKYVLRIRLCILITDVSSNLK